MMRKNGYKTLCELNLTEDDFNIEIIESSIVDETTIRPIVAVEVTVNGVKFKFPFHISIEYIMELRSYQSINYEYYINRMIKTQAVEIYINNTKLIRKHKLLKIIEEYETQNSL